MWKLRVFSYQVVVLAASLLLFGAKRTPTPSILQPRISCGPGILRGAERMTNCMAKSIPAETLPFSIRMSSLLREMLRIVMEVE